MRILLFSLPRLDIVQTLESKFNVARLAIMNTCSYWVNIVRETASFCTIALPRYPSRDPIYGKQLWDQQKLPLIEALCLRKFADVTLQSFLDDDLTNANTHDLEQIIAPPTHRCVAMTVVMGDRIANFAKT